jgi:hypothetical protein
VLFEDGEDVLEKIELFVARARPEIVAMRTGAGRESNALENVGDQI